MKCAIGLKQLFCGASYLTHPLPESTVHCLVHWNANGWPSVHCDTTGRPSEYNRVHWNTTVKKLRWNCTILGCHWRKSWLFQPTLECHWMDCNSPHTQAHILSRVASTPVLNDKMTGPQAASGQASVNSAFIWSLLLCNGHRLCPSNLWLPQHHSVHVLDMSTIIVCVFGVVVQMKSAWLKQFSPYQLV